LIDFFTCTFVAVLLTVCSGAQCLVEVSANEIFVEGCDVPSVILSALQSAQRQQSCVAGSGYHSCSCDVSRQSTTSTSTADSVTDKHSDCCSRRHGSKNITETRRRWRPLLLVIPLRLGLSEINPVYFSAIKVN